MSNTFFKRTVRSYYPTNATFICSLNPYLLPFPLATNLHSPERHLIELRIEHADLDALIDRAATDTPVDELMMRRLKKRRLLLRDEIARVERELEPNEPA